MSQPNNNPSNSLNNNTNNSSNKATNNQQHEKSAYKNTAQVVDDYLAKFDNNFHNDTVDNDNVDGKTVDARGNNKPFMNEHTDDTFSEDQLATIINVKRFNELLTKSDDFLANTNSQISNFE